MDLVTITIPNWSKFNPRSDRANYSWFRLENSFFNDQGVFALNDSQKILLLFFLCECSKKNKDSIEIRTSYISAILQRKQKDILDDIFVLSESRLLVAESRQDDGKEPSLSLTTRRTNETNVTNERDTHSRLVFDFESLYKKYPRKEGKSEGIARCKAQIKTQDDFDLLSRAIDRYRLMVSTNGVEPKYVKHFSSFLGTNDKQVWRDWLDPSAGRVLTNPPAPESKIANTPVEEIYNDPAKVKEICAGIFKSIKGAS